MSTFQNMPHSKHKQRGLTIVELMISVTLSLILIAGIFQIFSSSKQSYRVQDNLGRLQENARFAMDLLTYDIRMAGNTGCNKNANISYQVAGLTPIGSGIQGFESTDMPMTMLAAEGLTAANVIAGTDSILIKGAGGNSSDLTQASTATTVVADINTADGIFEVGDIAVVADCDNADIFQVTAVNSDAVAITLTHAGLSQTYGLDAQVMPLAYSVYYINTDDNGIRNLYRRSIGNNAANVPAVLAAEPLIENVQDMQILYGQDINGDGTANRYVDADDPLLNMAQVTSVRINLLLATSENNLAPEPQSYWFADTEFIPADDSEDRHLFRSISTTISMRN